MRCIEMCFISTFSYEEKSLSQAKCFILKTPVSVEFGLECNRMRTVFCSSNKKWNKRNIVSEVNPRLILITDEFCFPTSDQI